MKKSPLTLLVALLTCSACINTAVKDHSTAENEKVKAKANSSANLSSFNISYASIYTDSGTYYAAIQGGADSAPAVENTCGSSGINCYCDLYNSSGTLLGSAGGSASNILYNRNGNIITCKVTGNVGGNEASVAKIRLRNLAGSNTSTTTTLLTTVGSNGLSLQKALSGLDASYATTVYGYNCYIYARQKNYISVDTGWTCTDQGASDLKLLRTTYRYYVYANNYFSGVSYKSTDYIFNNNQFCNGAIAKQIDCTSPNLGFLSKDFGLYAKNLGMFSEKIEAYTGPNVGLAGYNSGFLATQGYAAPTTTFLGEVCPLGFEKRSLYNVTPATTFASDFKDSATCLTSASPSCTVDNELTSLANIQIFKPTGDLPEPYKSTCGTNPCISVARSTGGDCAPVVVGALTLDTCTMPTGAFSNYLSTAWASKNRTGTTNGPTSTFCVLASSLLP